MLSIEATNVDNELTKLCENRDGSTALAENGLAKLFRQILIDKDVSPSKLLHLLRDWQLEQGGYRSSNQKVLSRRRSSHIRSIAQPKVTWRMLKRGLALFRIRRYYLHIFYVTGSGEEGTCCISNKQNLNDLFQLIKDELGVDDGRLKLMLDEWFKHPEDSTDKVLEKRRRKSKGNFTRGMTSSSLTWNFFIIGLSILDVADFELELRLEWASGAITYHEAQINTTSELKNLGIKGVKHG